MLIPEHSFNPQIPELYQLEVTNFCNLKCSFCSRDNFPRPLGFLNLDLAKKISERDLDGSYFVEFQMSGEPLLHAGVTTIIDYFKGKVITGLSTNGHLIDKRLDAVCKLDYMTISVDSFLDYENLRIGGNSEHLISNIELLLKHRPSSLCIDLQVIELGGERFKTDWKKSLDNLKEFVYNRKWDVNIRTVPDCFLGTRDGMKIDFKELCLNPWLSVSVQWDGDVVPCCFAFGKDIVYGNLNEDTLYNIWNNSEVRKQLQEQHLKKNYNSLCSKCYGRSPAILHQSIFQNSYVKRVKNGI